MSSSALRDGGPDGTIGYVIAVLKEKKFNHAWRPAWFNKQQRPWIQMVDGVILFRDHLSQQEMRWTPTQEDLLATDWQTGEG